MYAVLICEWRFRNFWDQLISTDLSSFFFTNSSAAIECTCFTQEDQFQAWRRRIQSHIATFSSELSLWKCWLRTEAVFRLLIRFVRVLFGMSCWRAIFVMKEFWLTAVASFQRAWASVMRSFCESSISLDWSSSRVSIPTFWPDSSTWYQPSDPARILGSNILTRPDIDSGSILDPGSRPDSPRNRIWRQEG